MAKKQPTVRDLQELIAQQAKQLQKLTDKLSELEDPDERPGEKAKVYRPDVVKVLEKGPATARQIADKLGSDMWPVYKILRSMRADEGVKLITVDDEPMWKLQIKAEAADLMAWIEDMITENPLTQGDLEIITGASRTRVAGAITALQRHHGAVGLAEKNWKQGWYIPTDDERDSQPIYEADPPKRTPTVTEQTTRAKRKRQRKRAVASTGQARANRSRSRRSRRDPSGEDPAKPLFQILSGETRSAVP